MFMLSAGQSRDFDDADREALRAITEAGVAALNAEIGSSKVVAASSLREDERLKEALGRATLDPDDLEAGQYPMPQVLAEVTEEHRVEHQTDTTLAALDPNGKLLAVNGIAEPSIDDLVQLEAYRNVPPSDSAVFSVLVGGNVYVANVMPVDENGYRLVAVEPLNIGAGSILRRVLGSSQPAALVRNEKLVGGMLGDQPLTEEIKSLYREHIADTPVSGASKVFTVGDGLDTRIGALGRMPGPAGEGKTGIALVAVSRRTAAAGQQDLGDALREAQSKGVRLNWVLLGSLLVVSVALALYLPSLEGSGPLRRLTAEFQAVATGAQHQIFHDRYGGPAGELARTAAGTIEALRHAFLAELEIDEEDEGVAPRVPSRSSRQRRLSRAHENLRDTSGRLQAPEPTPEDDEPRTEINPNPGAPPAKIPVPLPRPADEGDDGHTVPMTQRLSVGGPGGGPPPPPKGASAAPPAPPFAPPTDTAPADPDDTDAYYREIFDEFVQVKMDCGEPTENLSFERFAAKLRKNERDLKASRPDIAGVRFSVYIKDGRAALKAKVVR
jgi:hypothetical protein